MHQHSHQYPLLLLILIITIVFSACAEIRVVTIPPPAASPRLRVYVEPFTTFADGKRGWDIPHEEFVKNQVRLAEKHLAQTGIYEIVSKEEVRAAIGGQRLTRYRMERNEWALARKVGRALHADYVMIMERGTNSLMNEKYFINVLINVETGKKFGVQYSFTRRGIPGKMKEIVRASYRDVFRRAKSDLFATAIKKSRRIGSPAEHGATPGTQIPVVSPVPSEQAWLKKRDVEDVLTQDAPVTSGRKLVVYDLDASEQYKPAALIFSEALREEIFKLRKFTLVNREDLDQVLKEMALQQTGLIDEKEAVKTGKGLAANQVVTGRMGLLGKTFVLQAKRIDVETFATLGLASTKFIQGHEDDAFDKMQEFAIHLTGQ